MKLQEIVHRIRASRRGSEIVEILLDTLPAFIGTTGVGFASFHDDGRVDLEWTGIEDAAVDCYYAHVRSGSFSDPLLRAALELTRAMANSSFAHDATWLALYNETARPFGYRHIAVAPVVVFDRGVGAITCMRNDGARAFTEQELADLMSVSIWSSSALSRIGLDDGSAAVRLSKRQREICELVLRGLTNAEIGVILTISENTVKKHLKDVFLRYGISRRAELVSLLR